MVGNKSDLVDKREVRACVRACVRARACVLWRRSSLLLIAPCRFFCAASASAGVARESKNLCFRMCVCVCNVEKVTALVVASPCCMRAQVSHENTQLLSQELGVTILEVRRLSVRSSARPPARPSVRPSPPSSPQHASRS